MGWPLRVGVIGAGGMGARHAENLSRHVPGAELAAVMDPDQDRARAIAEAAGAAVVDDAEELIASPTIDALIIASPDATHGPLARACLDACKPVLLEKPLAVTLTEAAAIVEQEAALGRRLIQIGLMRRYDPQHVALAARLTGGAVGRPLMFRGWHRNPPEATPPTASEILIQAAVHDLYSVRWLMRQEIMSIHAIGTTIDPSRTDERDLQLLSLTLDGGAVGSIEVNKNSGFGYEVGVEVTGDRGIISTAPHHAPIIRHEGLLAQAMEADWLERFDRAYVLEVQTWAAAAASGSATGPSAWDGYRTLAASIAAAESLEQRTPVDVGVLAVPSVYVDQP